MAQALRGNWVPGVAMVRVNAGYAPRRWEASILCE
jgi:hypothetical protein